MKYPPDNEQSINRSKRKDIPPRLLGWLSAAVLIALLACNFLSLSNPESQPAPTVAPFIPKLIQTFTQIPEELLNPIATPASPNLPTPTPTKVYPTRTPQGIVMLNPDELDLSKCKKDNKGNLQALAYSYQNDTELEQCFEVNPDPVDGIIYIRTQFSPPNNTLPSVTSVKAPINIEPSCRQFSINWAGTDDRPIGPIVFQGIDGDNVYTYTPTAEDLEHKSAYFYNPYVHINYLAMSVQDDGGLNDLENPLLVQDDKKNDITVLDIRVNLAGCQ